MQIRYFAPWICQKLRELAVEIQWMGGMIWIRANLQTASLVVCRADRTKNSPDDFVAKCSLTVLVRMLLTDHWERFEIMTDLDPADNVGSWLCGGDQFPPP